VSRLVDISQPIALLRDRLGRYPDRRVRRTPAHRRDGVHHGAWPSAGLNTVWLLVGVVALARLRPMRVPPPER
jgi:hypothetical protein